VPEFSKLSSDEKEDVKEMVGDLLLEEIESFLDKSSSPVEGGKYKARKKDGEASQLYETGDMRSTLEWVSVRGGIKVGIFEPNEAPKAFNHNVGDTLPVRRFIPMEGESFKPAIQNKIRKLVLNAIED
jgi:hypothetical protein